MRRSFWRAYAVLLRPYLMFVSGVSGAAGLALVDGLWPAVSLAALMAFFFSYGLGQALTDVFQTDTDAISSPYRPLASGEVSARAVLAVSIAGLVACGVVLAALDPWNLALSAAAIFGLVAYTPAKRRWWAGPWWNAWIVALLPVMGARAGGGAVPARQWAAVAASVFFSYAIFVLLGYFKDISADRATGYVTLPVRAGWRVSVVASGLLLAGAVAASAAYLAALEQPSRWGLGLWVAGIAALAWAHVRMWRTSDEKHAHPAIAWSVRGYVLLHLGEIAALRPRLLAAALVYYGAFELMLARRPERTQI